MSEVTKTVVEGTVTKVDTVTGDALDLFRKAVADVTDLAGAAPRIAGKTADAFLVELEAARKSLMDLIHQGTGDITKHIPF